MDFLAKIEMPLLCERMSGGSYGEPLNVLSALVTLVFCAVALNLWLKEGRRDPATLLLGILLAFTAISSAVFHSFPSPLTMYFEVLPVFLFVLWGFALVLHRMFRFDWLTTALNIVGFVLVAVLFALILPKSALGGGAQFLAPMIALYVLGAALIITARMGMHDDERLTGAAAARSDAVHFPRLKAGYGLLQMGILFVLALVARTLDMPMCASWPYGMHFIWHLLVGVAAFKLVIVCIRFPTDLPQPGGGAVPPPDAFPRRQR